MVIAQFRDVDRAALEHVPAEVADATRASDRTRSESVDGPRGSHHGLSATVLIDPAVELYFETGEYRYLELAKLVVEQAGRIDARVAVAARSAVRMRPRSRRERRINCCGTASGLAKTVSGDG